MRSIIYNGIDLSDICSAEVVEKVAQPVVSDVLAVPGRAGAMIVSRRIPPRTVHVRLFMDAGFKPDMKGLADARHKVYAALCRPDGGTLVLPDEPELFYRDAVCTDAGTWSSLFEDGCGEVAFTLYDPVAYGAERNEHSASFGVGGSWPTWPVFELAASAGAAVQVCYGGKLLRVEHAFLGGETVAIDCEKESVAIGGVDARADVTLASDYFALSPGNCELSVTGCASFEVTFRERWL